MRKARVTWVLIADGEHARIVTPGKHGGSFHTVTQFDSPTMHQRSSDLGTSKPGRSFESSGSTRHAIEPKHDLHRMEKERFAERIAEHLISAAALGHFDRLVLVAPPRSLNTIRDALDEAAASRLVGTLTKDLVKVPDHELGEHLAAWASRANLQDA